MNNATANARKDEIIQLVGIDSNEDKREFNSALSHGCDFMILSDGGRFYWQYSELYTHNLKCIPDKWIDAGEEIYEVIKNIGPAKLRSGNFSIKDVFKDNNYFLDR